jgi:hypothetical protein
MRETMASSVISWSTCAVVKLNAIIKIHKYRGLQEGHHFILMAMEVHGAPNHDLDCFIKERARFFHDWEVIYPFFLHSIFQVVC